MFPPFGWTAPEPSTVGLGQEEFDGGSEVVHDRVLEHPGRERAGHPLDLEPLLHVGPVEECVQ